MSEDRTEQARLLESEVPTCEFGQTGDREDCDANAEFVLEPTSSDYNGTVYRCYEHRDKGPLGMWGAELAFDRRRLDGSDVRSRDADRLRR